MSSSYRTDIFLKRLYYIQLQCADAQKKKIEEDTKQDKFVVLRKSIAEQIRTVRQLIHDRNQSNASTEIGAEALAAAGSHQIRLEIKNIHERINDLAKMQRRRQKKLQNRQKAQNDVSMEVVKMPPDVENDESVLGQVTTNNDPCEMTRCEMEAQVVLYARRHIQELEQMERYGDEAIEHPNLFDDADKTEMVYGVIPDIDDAQFKLLIANDQALDQDLDEIHAALLVVKKIAEGINSELELQEELIDRVEQSMTQVEEKVTIVNMSLKRVLKSVRAPRQFFCDICLCCVILGVAAAIIYLLAK